MKPSSLQARLLQGTMAVVVAFVAISLMVFFVLLGRFAESDVHQSLLQARRAYQRYSDLTLQLLADRVAALSEIPYVKATLGIPGVDQETVQHLLHSNFEARLGECLLACDAEGKLLAKTTNEGPLAEDLSLWPGVDQVLLGEPITNLWSGGDRLWHVAASPVIAGEELLGFLALCEPLDQRAADAIRDVTARDVLIVQGERIVARSWRTTSSWEEHRNDWLAWLDLGDPFSAEPTDVGNAHKALAFALHTQAEADEPSEQGRGVVVLSRALQEVQRLYYQSFLGILVTGVVIVLLGAWLSGRIARKLSQPIRELTGASQQLAEGNLAVKVSAKGVEEVETLSDAFNSMAQRIGQLLHDVQEKAFEAESANRSKDRFLTSMSHELRTPLTNIQAFVEIMRTQQPLERQETEEFLTIVEDESRHLSELVAQIMEFANIESGQGDWRVAIVRLEDLVRSAVHTLSVSHGDKDVRYHFSPDANLPPYLGDRDRLSQVIQGLLTNAWKFSPERSVITINLQNREQHMLLTVADQGPGVPAEDQAHIFKEFHQSGDGITDKPAGTGLGLAITRQIIVLHGGRITYSDAEGGGAVFTVELPHGPDVERRPIDRLVRPQEPAPPLSTHLA
jgi:signal transduction histidine kinase